MNEIVHERLFLVCECYSHDHMMLVEWYEDQDSAELSFNPILNLRHTFLARIPTALKYVFGRKATYSVFDSVVLSEEDLPKLQNLLSKHEETLKRQHVDKV